VRRLEMNVFYLLNLKIAKYQDNTHSILSGLILLKRKKKPNSINFSEKFANIIILFAESAFWRHILEAYRYCKCFLSTGPQNKFVNKCAHLIQYVYKIYKRYTAAADC